MDISTTYLGFKLPNPFIVGAGPISDTLENAKRAEDAGAAAIVMRSLFKEQIDSEASAQPESSEEFTGSASESSDQGMFILNKDRYLEQLMKIKEAVDIPVLASLNGYEAGEWLNFSKTLEEAGADALELNLFYVASNLTEDSATIENRALEMVKWIKKTVSIPLAVKLSPFYTSTVSFAHKLQQAGADGMVLFNRYYEADIDVEQKKIFPIRQLSDSRELLIRLRWLAIISGNLNSANLAVSGGVHSAVDAIKAIMCGASAIQMVSALLKHGPEHLSKVRGDMIRWMEEKEQKSLADIHRCMDIVHSRANYMHLLQASTWA